MGDIMKKRIKIDISKLDLKIIVLNLYLTQLITLILAFLIFFLFYQWTPLEALLSIIPSPNYFGWVKVGFLYGVFIVAVEIFFSKKIPDDWMDDGGLNERLFRNIPVWHIAIIAIIVGFVEEFLFRAALQQLIGIFMTSIIFTSVHFRYLKKWLLIIATFLISYGLGFIVNYTGEWSTAFIAHTVIDFTLGLFIRKRWLQ